MIKQFGRAIVLAFMGFASACSTEPVSRFTGADLLYEFIPAGKTRLTGGVLEDRYYKNIVYNP